MINILRKITFKLIHPKYLIFLISWKNYFFGEYELKILKNYVPKDKNAIDIGAHRGIYSFFLSKLAKKVFIYEPNPELVKFIKNAQIGNCQVNQIAVSNNATPKILRLPYIGNQLVSSWGSLENKFEENEKCKSYSVDCKKLDDIYPLNVGFMKIDVEGHESNIISGASKFLKETRPIILVEIEQRHNKKPIKNIFDKIISYKYEGFYFYKKTMLPIESFNVSKLQNLSNKIYINNFLFLPKE